MRKVAALALILIQTAVFYGQEMLRLLSESEYEEARTNIKWQVDNGYSDETSMESWEEDCKELMAIDGLPVYVKSMFFEEKSGINISQSSSDTIFKLQEISKERICYVKQTIHKGYSIDKIKTGWEWEIYTIRDSPRNPLESCRMAIKCYFRDERLKIAVWKLDEWSNENRCKEIAGNLAEMIEFALE